MADASDGRVSGYVCQSGALVYLNTDDATDSDHRDLFEFVDIPAVSVHSRSQFTHNREILPYTCI